MARLIDEKPELLTTAEVARLLRVDPTTIRRWVKAGQINAIPLPNGKFRFHESELRQLLQLKPS